METLELNLPGVRVVRATKKHSREMARILRAKDRDEVLASANFQPEQAIRSSINASSEAYALYAGGDLLDVFGVGPLPGAPGAHVVWSMSSVHVNKHLVSFWKASKAVISYFRGKYPVMVNMLHSKYPEAARWVERLGFTISPPEVFGPRGDLFCRITLVTPKLTEVSHV